MKNENIPRIQSIFSNPIVKNIIVILLTSCLTIFLTFSILLTTIIFLRDWGDFAQFIFQFFATLPIGITPTATLFFGYYFFPHKLSFMASSRRRILLGSLILLPLPALFLLFVPPLGVWIKYGPTVLSLINLIIAIVLLVCSIMFSIRYTRRHQNHFVPLSLCTAMVTFFILLTFLSSIFLFISGTLDSGQPLIY